MSIVRLNWLGFVAALALMLAWAFALPATAVAQDEGANAEDEEAETASETVFGTSRVPDTLMFTIDELNEIQSRLVGGDVTEEAVRTEAIEQANLYLSSIVYLGPNDWTIWVNGTPIGPSEEVDAFEVVSISPTAVQMIVPLSAAGMRPVRLEPNQTFISSTGFTLEGQWD